MNKFKFDAFLEEFPFLKEIIGEAEARWCDKIHVKRITSELLATTPQNYSVSGSSVNIDEQECIYFVLDDGSITDTVKAEAESKSNYAHEGDQYRPGETILEAIHRFCIANSVAYIVALNFGYSITNHCSDPNWQLAIFKPARDLAIAEAISEAQLRALAEVQAEADF